MAGITTRRETAIGNLSISLNLDGSPCRDNLATSWLSEQ